ncbi:MAG: SNF2-related protein [Candidatus Paceibacterota bacterium]|jgi:hypothetical protein
MLSNVKLFDYQSDSLRMLIEQENNGHIGGLLGHCVLTDPERSGKSLVILALIAARPLPLVKEGSRGAESAAVAHIYDCSHDGAQAYVSIRATVPNQIIRPTCIVAPNYAYHHWINTIRGCTSFRAYTIATKKDAHAFCAMALNGEANDYDIVLINYSPLRATTMANSSGGTFVDICHLINKETMPMMWARVVYDNAHDLADAMQMRAISSIYVSSRTTYMSREHASFAQDTNQYINTSLRNLVCDLAPVKHIYDNTSAHIWATCGHDAHTVARDACIPDIMWISVIIGQLIPDDHEIARELMISTYDNYLVDIGQFICPKNELLSRVIGDSQYDNYCIARARMIIMRDLAKCATNDASAIAKYSRAHEVIITRALHLRAHYSEQMTTTIATAPTTEYDSLAIPREISDLSPAHYARCDEIIKQCESFAIRVSENIARDECAICYMSLHETGAIAIMRCCGICLCASCCLSVMSAHQSDTIRNVRGQCVQCRREIRLSEDIVFTRYDDGGLGLFVNLVKSCDEACICEQVCSLACVKTKIDYIIELARSGCIPSNSQYVDARVYNGPTNSADIDTTIATYGGASDERQQHSLSATQTGGAMMAAVTSPILLVYSPEARVLDRVKYAACMEFMRESRVTIKKQVGSSSSASSGSSSRASSQDLSFILINASCDVPLIMDMRVTTMPWITDLVLMSPMSREHMIAIIDMTQCIGRTQTLRIHMLEYAH